MSWRGSMLLSTSPILTRYVGCGTFTALPCGVKAESGLTQGLSFSLEVVYKCTSANCVLGEPFTLREGV